MADDRAQPESGPTDEALMGAFAARGDAGAFDALVGRYLPKAVAVARCLLSPGLSADDAVQEAFLLLLRHRKRYRRGKPFSPWFYTILRNVCRGMRRTQGRQGRLLAQAAERVRAESAGKPAPEPPRLQDLLAGLDEADRAVLTLRVVDGLGFEEIAAAMGIAREAAKKRAQRALHRLREGTAAREARPGADGKDFPTRASPDRPGRNSDGQE